MKRLFLATILLSLAFQVKTQITDFTSSLNHGYFFKPENLGVSSTQVSDFVRNINLYNGLLDLNIKLEEYKDNDFTIPISLQYVSSGFIPSKRPSPVGYNWVLKCGGVITRTVHGSPDDVRGYYTATESSKYKPDGLWAAVKNDKFKFYNEASLNSFTMEKNQAGTQTPFFNGDFKYDFEPDIFHFSFGDYQGSFMINNYGQVEVVSQKDCKIDISGLTIQPHTWTSSSSIIKITTPDGYIYEFGGNWYFYEYFVPNNPNYAFNKPGYITSWFLNSIQAPNGRRVTFHYDYYNNQQQKINYNHFVYASDDITTHLLGGCPSFVSAPKTSQLLDKHLIFVDEVHTPFLSSIQIGNTTIKFNHIPPSSGFYSNHPDGSRKLASIELLYNNSRVNLLKFNYFYKGGYFFLDSYEKDNAKHQFSYNLPQNLPDPMTISTDHWGFWSGGNQTSVSNVAQYCLNIESHRASIPSLFNVGLLKEVIYPMGGRTEITYESNQYKYYYERESNSINHTRKTWSSPVKTGGARVQSIADYNTDNKMYNYREYHYKDALNGTESGTIYLKPKYSIEETIYTSGVYNYSTINPGTGTHTAGTCAARIETKSRSISANNLGVQPFSNEYFIHYPNVLEVFQDGSYIHYTYSSLLDTPDDNNVHFAINKPANVTDRSLNNFQLAEKYNLYMLNDMSLFRGRLLSKSMYSADKKRKMSEIYTYNTSEAKSRYNISVKSVPMGMIAYKNYLTDCLLMRKETIDENNVSQIVDYKYNKHNLVSETSFVRNDGKRQITKFTYPFELSYELMGAFPNFCVNSFFLYFEFHKLLSKDNKKLIDNNSKIVNRHRPFLLNIANSQEYSL